MQYLGHIMYKRTKKILLKDKDGQTVLKKKKTHYILLTDTLKKKIRGS